MGKENLYTFISKIEEATKSNADEINRIAPEAVRSAWHIMITAKNIVFKSIVASSKSDDSLKASLLLLHNCLTDLVEALIGCRAGFLRGPGTILRCIWENVALAVVIFKDPTKYTKYKVGKLDPSKAVTDAKKIFPEFGSTYGDFSGFFVHESFKTIERGVEREGGQVIYTLVPQTRSRLGPLLLLLEIAWCARYVALVAEYCSVSYLSEFHFWRKIGNDHLKELKDTEDDRLIKTLIDEFEKEISLAESQSTT